MSGTVRRLKTGALTAMVGAIVAIGAAPQASARDECALSVTQRKYLEVDKIYQLTAVGSPAGGTYHWTVSQPGGQVFPTDGWGSDFYATTLDPSDSIDDVTINVTYTAPSGDVCSKAFTLTVARIRIQSVTFGGSGTYSVRKDCSSSSCPMYETPHWLDLNADGEISGASEHESPVAFVRASNAILSGVKFDVLPVDLGQNSVGITGIAPDGVRYTGWGSMGNGEVSAYGDLTASQPLPNVIRAYNTYDIAWQVALSNTEVLSGGTSSNRMYVTLDDPVGDRMVSYFDISTKAADGASTVEDAIDAIWAEFADREVVNADDELMGYYRDVLCASYLSIYDAPGLVMTLNGQCGAWRDLLIQCFRTQGIGGAEYVDINPTSAPGFLVNNYAFAPGAGTSGCPNYPYRYDPPCPWGTMWPAGTVEVTDVDGLPGQDESNPASYFARHFIVKINGKYYDPAYGAGPFEGTKDEANMVWEQGGVAGYHDSCGSRTGARKDVPDVLETWFSR